MVKLDNINTVVCERFNLWGGGFKHMLKHINYQRFHFFCIIIFDFYNIQKLKN